MGFLNAFGVKKSRSRGRSHKKQVVETEASIYCSDMYTEQFVLRELHKVRTDDNIVKVHIEDLLQCNDPVRIKVAKELLVDTSVEVKSQRLERKLESKSRSWQSITFTDSFTNAQEYQDYTETKKTFGASLMRLLAMKKLQHAIPIQSQAKIELRSMMDVETILDCLREVKRDSSVVRIEFPDFDFIAPENRQEEIPNEFMALIDASTMEWTGQSIEILLHYDKPEQRESKAAARRRAVDRNIIKECLKRLKDLQVAEKEKKAASTDKKEKKPSVTDSAKKAAAKKGAAKTNKTSPKVKKPEKPIPAKDVEKKSKKKAEGATKKPAGKKTTKKANEKKPLH